MTKPRFNPPVCWLCDRKLYAGGTVGVTIIEHGHEHPAHRVCAEQTNAVIKRETDELQLPR